MTTESIRERLEIRRELLIAARPETVWEFLVDETKQQRWMGGAATIDPRPGGVVRIEVVSGQVVSGEVVEADPPRRLVYTWGWEGGSDDANVVPPGSSTVEFELEPSLSTAAEAPNGLPTSTSASPSCPIHAPHAAIAAFCSSSVAAMPPPL